MLWKYILKRRNKSFFQLKIHRLSTLFHQKTKKQKNKNKKNKEKKAIAKKLFFYMPNLIRKKKIFSFRCCEYRKVSHGPRYKTYAKNNGRVAFVGIGIHNRFVLPMSLFIDLTFCLPNRKAYRQFSAVLPLQLQKDEKKIYSKRQVTLKTKEHHNAFTITPKNITMKRQ